MRSGMTNITDIPRQEESVGEPMVIREALAVVISSRGSHISGFSRSSGTESKTPSHFFRRWEAPGRCGEVFHLFRLQRIITGLFRGVFEQPGTRLSVTAGLYTIPTRPSGQ